MSANRSAAADERGQVMPLLLVGALVVAIGFAAFAIDVGHAYFAKRQLQASADAAALSGAQILPDVDAAVATAQQFGSSGKNRPRGVDDVQMDVTTKCLKSAPGCAPANAIVVRETAELPTKFAKLLGIGSFSLHASSTACSPCGQKPLDVMIVLDRTGSMSGADLDNAREGIKTFLGLMDPELDYVGLAVLPPAETADACGGIDSNYQSGSPHYVVVPLGKDDYLVDGKLNESSTLVSAINCIGAGGSTSYATALEQAQAELDRHGRPGVQKIIIFLSDGAANTGPSSYPQDSPYRTTPCHQGDASARQISAGGTTVFSIAYGLRSAGQGKICEGLNKQGNNWIRGPEKPAISAEEALRGIASSSDNFYNKPDPGQLNTIFTSIAADILRGHSKLVDDNA